MFIFGFKNVPNLGSFKHATFLSHGRQPEVDFPHARTVMSPRFIN